MHLVPLKEKSNFVYKDGKPTESKHVDLKCFRKSELLLFAVLVLKFFFVVVFVCKHNKRRSGTMWVTTNKCISVASALDEVLKNKILILFDWIKPFSYLAIYYIKKYKASWLF